MAPGSCGLRATHWRSRHPLLQRAPHRAGDKAMKIPLDSSSGQRLMQHGVERRELNAARIYVFNMQLGGAITLPFPFLGPVILIKRRWLVFDDEDELEDSPRIRILRHELCHVRQLLDWGGLAYMRRQVWARIKTLSLYAKTAPEESVCYSAQAKVQAFYRNRRPT